jgi:hypothetical protein
MQVHPGVFVSNTSTEEWRPDPEIGGGADEHVLLVLEVRARIDIEDGPTLDLGPGDMASLPTGAVTRWHLTLRRSTRSVRTSRVLRPPTS